MDWKPERNDRDNASQVRLLPLEASEVIGWGKPPGNSEGVTIPGGEQGHPGGTLHFCCPSENLTAAMESGYKLNKVPRCHLPHISSGVHMAELV